MTKRSCPTSGCGSLTEGGYCTRCTRDREQARGTRQERGYDAAYDEARRVYERRMARGEVFTCWRCAELGRPHPVDPSPGAWQLGHDNDDRTIIRGPQCAASNLDTSRTSMGAASQIGGPSSPPERIDPGTLVKPLLDATGPLPAGTGLYDSDGHLVAVLGESVPSPDPDVDFTASLMPPPSDKTSRPA